jgi:hypothetical protein
VTDLLTAFYRSANAMRSRSIAACVPTTTLDVPAPPERLQADWSRDIALQLGLEAGDVEPLPLARAQALARLPALRAGHGELDAQPRSAITAERE